MRSYVVEESSNSVRVFWLKADQLIEDLKSTAENLGRKDENVVKIVLFGSLAEGKAVPGSDADILVLLKKSERPFLSRISDWAERFSINFPIEVFPFTLKESDNPIVKKALENGIILFERKISNR